MSLYASYRSISHYYQSPDLKQKYERFLTRPNGRTANDFIKRYFEVGRKDRVFDLIYQGYYELKGKHLHTVSLYSLGVHLSRFIEQYVTDNRKQFVRNYELLDYKYTWFLTSLYHDAGGVIENNKSITGSCEHFKSLGYHLGQHSVEYNPYQYVQVCSLNNIEHAHSILDYFTFPENVIKNYFFYRADYHHKVDHGIMAGYLFFDRLKKNYDKAWKEKEKRLQGPDPNENYAQFSFNGLSWRAEHLVHFACIANSIISHNIWFGNREDKNAYKRYGLDCLMSPSVKKINIRKWPLLFFLGLVDTIEPVKRFTEESNTEVDFVLKGINIDFDGKIVISIIDPLLIAHKRFEKWLDGIYSLPNWLSIEVNPSRKSDFRETISLKPILGDDAHEALIENRYT